MPKINILPPDVARKIAAGEVIDRPASVLRELLDNAIDSGADTIEVRLSDGGISEVTVTDNGCGMDEEDLRRSILPHATSKIFNATDMDTITSLGFRGEALASVTACAHMEILTRPAGADGAFRLTANGIDEPQIEATAGAYGTTVTVRELFYNIPARKKFLSSPSGESNACTNIFIEKATAHPHIAFRLFVNGKPKLFFQRSDLKQRVAAVLKGVLEPQALRFSETDFGGFKIALVGADPGFFRKDKKYIRIFLNKRAIVEYAFVQAVEFAYRETLQSVCYPYCYVFIEIDPALVDFNIHPAKREVRVRNKDDVHHAVVTAVRALIAGNGDRVPTAFTPKNVLSTVEPKLFDESRLPESHFSMTKKARSYADLGMLKKESQLAQTIYSTKPWNASAEKSPLSFPKAAAPSVINCSDIYERRVSEDETCACEPNPFYLSADLQTQTSETVDFIYHGQIFDLFLLAEKGDRFYIIDQHAAHERILFESFRNAPPQRQPLLAPLKLEVDNSQKIESVIESLKTAGIEIEQHEDGLYLTAIGQFWEGKESLIAEELNRPFISLFELEKRLTASFACKSAIKDGDPISPETAVKIINDAFKLENPHCPHGRPIWFCLSRNDLFKLVGRIV